MQIWMQSNLSAWLRLINIVGNSAAPGNNKTDTNPGSHHEYETIEHGPLDQPGCGGKSGIGPDDKSTNASGATPKAPTAAHPRSEHTGICHGQGVA